MPSITKKDRQKTLSPCPSVTVAFPKNLTQTREVLFQLGHRPIHHWGQNFLIDHNIIEKSLGLANITTGDKVVEIGAGLGHLSGALLDRGAIVYAVEIDKRLGNYLTNQSINTPRLQLLIGDAVCHPMGNKEKDHKPWKVVSNLPYSISTPWLDSLLDEEDYPESMTLMLQKETATRFMATEGSKHFGAISIRLQLHYEVAATHAVSRHCFYPQPKVDSMLLHLVRKDEATPLDSETYRIIRGLFTQRRKQLQSSTKFYLPSEVTNPWGDYLERNGLSLGARPEVIPLHCWQALARVLQHHGKKPSTHYDDPL